MPGESQKKRKDAAENNRSRKHVSHNGNAEEKYQDASDCENGSDKAFSNPDLRTVDLRA